MFTTLHSALLSLTFSLCLVGATVPKNSVVNLNVYIYTSETFPNRRRVFANDV